MRWWSLVLASCQAPVLQVMPSTPAAVEQGQPLAIEVELTRLYGPRDDPAVLRVRGDLQASLAIRVAQDQDTDTVVLEPRADHPGHYVVELLERNRVVAWTPPIGFTVTRYRQVQVERRGDKLAIRLHVPAPLVDITAEDRYLGIFESTATIWIPASTRQVTIEPLDLDHNRAGDPFDYQVAP